VFPTWETLVFVRVVFRCCTPPLTCVMLPEATPDAAGAACAANPRAACAAEAWLATIGCALAWTFPKAWTIGFQAAFPAAARRSSTPAALVATLCARLMALQLRLRPGTRARVRGRRANRHRSVVRSQEKWKQSSDGPKHGPGRLPGGEAHTVVTRARNVRAGRL